MTRRARFAAFAACAVLAVTGCSEHQINESGDRAASAVASSVRAAQPALKSSERAARDIALAAEVHANLVAQTGVNALHVRVAARGTTITLSGRAASAGVKQTLLAAARRTPGVATVVDRVEIRS